VDVAQNANLPLGGQAWGLGDLKMRHKAIIITDDQADWIKTNKFNLSEFVINKLQKHIDNPVKR